MSCTLPALPHKLLAAGSLTTRRTSIRHVHLGASFKYSNHLKKRSACNEDVNRIVRCAARRIKLWSFLRSEFIGGPHVICFNALQHRRDNVFSNHGLIVQWGHDRPRLASTLQQALGVVQFGKKTTPMSRRLPMAIPALQGACAAGGRTQVFDATRGPSLPPQCSMKEAMRLIIAQRSTKSSPCVTREFIDTIPETRSNRIRNPISGSC